MCVTDNVIAPTRGVRAVEPAGPMSCSNSALELLQSVRCPRAAPRATPRALRAPLATCARAHWHHSLIVRIIACSSSRLYGRATNSLIRAMPARRWRLPRAPPSTPSPASSPPAPPPPAVRPEAHLPAARPRAPARRLRQWWLLSACGVRQARSQWCPPRGCRRHSCRRRCGRWRQRSSSSSP